MPLTDKKRRYAEARLAGQGKKAAALAAGCPEKTASQAASRYEKDPDVIAHMERKGAGAPQKDDKAQKGQPKDQEPPGQEENTPEPDESGPESAIGALLRRGFRDPLDFMEAMMNDIAEDPKLRLDAAKSLAAYRCVKASEKGKKGEKQQAAERAAKGKFRSAPPPLKAVK